MSSVEKKVIVVPVDFSEASKHGLEYATWLARTLDARLSLVHVMEYHPTYHEFTVGVDWYTIDAIERVNRELDELGKSMVRDGVSFETAVLVEASIEDAIVDFARDREATLIVIGSHGRTGLPRLLMGSVAKHVLRRATCPVITVTPGQTLPVAA